LPSMSGGENATNANDLFVFTGCYTTNKNEGINVYCMDPANGGLTFVSKAAGAANPSYLAIDPQKRFLFAVNEMSRFEGKPQGALSSFAIDPSTMKLTFLNQQPSGGSAPCYITVDKTGKWVLIANYGGGSVAVFPIQDDGKLGPASDFVQHRGSSVNRQRQKEPHAHSIVLDPANRFAFAADLGMDKIMIYQFDGIDGKLKPNDPPYAEANPGSGPRHFTFHPNGEFAFLIQELQSTITSFAYDGDMGALETIQTVSALPKDFTGTSYSADIHVSPSGKFIYGSNRGHDSIVIYAIGEKTGKLEYIGHESTQGKTPRNFAIDPSGAFLLAANQDSDSIVTFRIDEETGKLHSTGAFAKTVKPVCLQFFRC
ncbi:MAG: lactonase family protein, partial [Candidatus Omnitrophota bacterium]